MDSFIKTNFDKLHSMPELGLCEVRTSAYLADCLEELGYQVKRNIGNTGILGVIDSGVPGPALALRADMDALPFEIDGESTAIHACGHDANCTMVLTAAKQAVRRGIRTGKLYILFQQAEEVSGKGAYVMAQTGAFSEIQEMVAVHLRPSQDAVLGEAAAGVAHSAAYFVDIVIKGKTAHGSRPFLGVNAIEIASAIIQAANGIRENVGFSFSLKPTQIHTAGGARNSIPDTCHLGFDLRGETNEIADSIIQKLQKICDHTAAMYGGAIEAFTYGGVPAAILDPEVTSLCDQAINRVLGKSLGIVKTTGGDDVYYFSQMCGIRMGYIGIGANVEYGLHHPRMCFDPHAMEIGADILEQVVDLRLGLGEK